MKTYFSFMHKNTGHLYPKKYGTHVEH